MEVFGGCLPDSAHLTEESARKRVKDLGDSTEEHWKSLGYEVKRTIDDIIIEGTRVLYFRAYTVGSIPLFGDGISN